MFRSSSLLFGFSARLCLALQMRILPFSFFAYNFFIHPQKLHNLTQSIKS